MIRRLFLALAGAVMLAAATLPAAAQQTATAVATFGSGCFWCTEATSTRSPA